MTRPKPRNVTASVHDRLLQLARQRQEDFQALLVKYGLERLLFRLSCSPHRETFILKGALLFALWSDRPHRPTKDLDLLGRGEFEGSLLCRALRATFQRRQTPLPSEPPTALAAEFCKSPNKVRQWQAFLRKSQLGAEQVGLEEVVSVLRTFLLPPAQALVRKEPFPMCWPAAGPWTTSPGAAGTASLGSGA